MKWKRYIALGLTMLLALTIPLGEVEKVNASREIQEDTTEGLNEVLKEIEVYRTLGENSTFITLKKPDCR